MSAQTAEVAAEDTEIRTPKRTRLGRIAYFGLAILAVLTIALLSILNSSNDLAYDPDNPGPAGWQAMAQVLADEGVTVEVSRGLDDLPDDLAESTVLVVGTNNLSPESGEQLLGQSAEADKVVVMAPAVNVGEVLDLPLRVEAGSTTVREPDCSSPLFREGDTMSGVGSTIVLTTRISEAITCLPPSAGFEAGGTQGGALVTLPETADHPEITVGGFADSFTNAAIAADANAAVALRLLGQSDTLVWLIPSPADLAVGNPQSLYDVLPRWFLPTAGLLGAVALAFMVIRGRRLGPLVTEPLPVTIRAMESVEARARLYERGNAHAHAYRSLQQSAQARWARRLGLGPQTPPEAIAAEVARYTNTPQSQVATLLLHHPASDDESFVRAARDLHALEEGNTPR